MADKAQGRIAPPQPYITYFVPAEPAVFGNTLEKFINTSNTSLTINKSLKKLEVCAAGKGPSSTGVSMSPEEPTPGQSA